MDRSTGHIVLCVCWEGVDTQPESVLKATVTPAWKILTQLSQAKCNQVTGTSPACSFGLSRHIDVSLRFNLKRIYYVFFFFFQFQLSLVCNIAV